MTDKKISELTALATADTADLLPIVDTSAGETKYITAGNLLAGATAVVLSATVTLTDADIAALPTTAFELVPAPGANKMILTSAYNGAPDGVVIVHHHVADYAGVAANAAFAFRLGSGNGAEVRVNGPVDDLLLWGATDDVIYIPDNAGGVSTSPKLNSLTDFANLPLQLIASNGGFTGGGPDFTGGDPANTMTVTVLYAIVDV